MSTSKYELLKQASEMKAQAYDLLGKADRILIACGDGRCGDNDCGKPAVGDPAPVSVVAPAASSGSLVLKLAQKTEILSILDHVASAIKGNEALSKHASELLDIASTIDRTAAVLEDGFETAGTTDIRYVNEMDTSFHGGVHEKGQQGEQSSKATDSFKTDRSMTVQDAVKKVLPYQKIST